MSDEKKYTEREKVLAEREAYRKGNASERAMAFGSGNYVGGGPVSAEKMYPLPKVTRPRIVVDRAGHEWTWVEGRLCFRQTPTSNWISASSSLIGEGARDALATLLANPTEEVDAEGY